MYHKALLFSSTPELLESNTKVAAKILAATHPRDVRSLGREVEGFSDGTWAENRYRIVLEGNRLKFGQNADIKDCLLETGDKTIVEASPRDRIWGIGFGEESRIVGIQRTNMGYCRRKERIVENG